MGSNKRGLSVLRAMRNRRTKLMLRPALLVLPRLCVPFDIVGSWASSLVVARSLRASHGGPLGSSLQDSAMGYPFGCPREPPILGREYWGEPRVI